MKMFSVIGEKRTYLIEISYKNVLELGLKHLTLQYFSGEMPETAINQNNSNVLLPLPKIIGYFLF
jgi:NADH:ubiquinone oxidoreductase subunit H